MIAVHYPTKKALKAAVGTQLLYAETSTHGKELVPGKPVPFVGPHEYKRVFYGTVTVDSDGVITRVQ